MKVGGISRNTGPVRIRINDMGRLKHLYASAYQPMMSLLGVSAYRQTIAMGVIIMAFLK